MSPSSWRTILAERPDLAAEPLVASWARRGLPLISRRPLPGEDPGVPLGLPLPPLGGKRRLSLLVRPEDILATAEPPNLADVLQDAPISWRPTLAQLGELASEHAIAVRVFGSLAWQALTGLDYVTAGSDLDVLFYVRPATDIMALAGRIAAVDAAAPMRVDGEVVRPDGLAVNWRELLGGSAEVLAKSSAGVELLDRERFCCVGAGG